MFDFKAGIDRLPEKEKEFFLSDKPMLEMKKAFIVLGIDPRLSKNIAYDIGLIYLGSLPLENLPNVVRETLRLNPDKTYGISYEINKRVFNKSPQYFRNSDMLLDQWAQQKASSVISETEAEKKIFEIEPWLLEVMRKEPEEEEEKKKAYRKPTISQLRLSLQRAIEKFENIKNQQVTSQPIKIYNFPDTIQPSIKNWLTDYQYNLGVGKHTPMERGNFIYRSPNGARLTESDRQRLALILKSYDEETPLEIDTANQRVTFPASTRVDASSMRGGPASQTGDRVVNFHSRPQNARPNPEFTKRMQQMEDYYPIQERTNPARIPQEREAMAGRPAQPSAQPKDIFEKNISRMSFEPRQTFANEVNRERPTRPSVSLPDSPRFASLDESRRAVEAGKPTLQKPRRIVPLSLEEEGHEDEQDGQPKIYGNVVNLK